MISCHTTITNIEIFLLVAQPWHQKFTPFSNGGQPYDILGWILFILLFPAQTSMTCLHHILTLNATNFSFQYCRPYNMHKHWDIFIWCFMMIQSSHTLLQWNNLMTTLGWIQFMRPFHARYQWHIFVLHHILKINAYELFSTCISTCRRWHLCHYTQILNMMESYWQGHSNAEVIIQIRKNNWQHVIWYYITFWNPIVNIKDNGLQSHIFID